MHVKTMEGLTGASMNMKMLNTPLRVYKDAERRGDTAVMERAMGYVGEFSEKAEDYQKKADEGMKEERKEAREKAKTEQENAIQKRREEREEQEKRIAESRKDDADTVGVRESKGGASDGETDTVLSGKGSSTSAEKPVDTVKTEPVIYTKSGGTSKPESGTNLSVSV